jgi:cholesterol transport system auxiliary component
MNVRLRGWSSAFAAAALLLPVLLGACGGLFPSPPARQLYRVEPNFAFPPDLPHADVQLAVATPSAVAGLDTQRIALARSPLSLDYFADGEWADSAPLLVRTAVVEGFEKSSAITAVGPATLGTYADFMLETAIRDFEAVYDGTANQPPRVRVAFELTLIRLPQRKIVAAALVRGEADAAANTVPAIVAAFNTALGRAVENAVTWTLATPGLSQQPGSVRLRTRFVHPDGDAKQ